jgi:hypothetical protein
MPPNGQQAESLRNPVSMSLTTRAQNSSGFTVSFCPLIVVMTINFLKTTYEVHSTGSIFLADQGEEGSRSELRFLNRDIN